MPRYTAPCWWLPLAEADSEFGISAIKIPAIHYHRITYAKRKPLDVDSGTHLGIEAIDFIYLK